MEASSCASFHSNSRHNRCTLQGLQADSFKKFIHHVCTDNSCHCLMPPYIHGVVCEGCVLGYCRSGCQPYSAHLGKEFLWAAFGSRLPDSVHGAPGLCLLWLPCLCPGMTLLADLSPSFIPCLNLVNATLCRLNVHEQQHKLQH